MRHGSPSGCGRWSGVVLAGGASSRMGFDKAFLELDGETLIRRQHRLLEACGAGEVLISGRAGAVYGIAGARVILDECPGHGPLGGILAALEAAANPRVLVLAVDMPGVTCGLVRTLLEQSTAATGCVPWIRGGIEPLAAVYPATLAADVRARLDGGDCGMRRWVEHVAAQGRVRLLEMPADHEACFRNWNTPSDLASEGRLGGEPSRR